MYHRYAHVLRLNGKTISNDKVEHICRYIFSICGWRTKYHGEIFTVNVVDYLRIDIDSLSTNNDLITSSLVLHSYFVTDPRVIFIITVLISQLIKSRENIVKYQDRLTQ